MRRLFLIFPFLMALSCSVNAEPTHVEMYDRGADLAQSCAGCHGIDGISPVASNPNLAGQKATYIEYALKLYRSQQRKGGMSVIMYGNAAGLSDNDIQALAVYFSSQKGSR